MSETLSYAMLIQWSDEDQAHLVTLPEWSDRVLMPVTHGDSYDDAASNGQEVLRLLIASAQEHGEPLPSPQTYDSTLVSAPGSEILHASSRTG